MNHEKYQLAFQLVQNDIIKSVHDIMDLKKQSTTTNLSYEQLQTILSNLKVLQTKTIELMTWYQETYNHECLKDQTDMNLTDGNKNDVPCVACSLPFNILKLKECYDYIRDEIRQEKKKLKKKKDKPQSNTLQTKEMVQESPSINKQTSSKNDNNTIQQHKQSYINQINNSNVTPPQTHLSHSTNITPPTQPPSQYPSLDSDSNRNQQILQQPPQHNTKHSNITHNENNIIVQLRQDHYNEISNLTEAHKSDTQLLQAESIKLQQELQSLQKEMQQKQNEFLSEKQRDQERGEREKRDMSLLLERVGREKDVMGNTINGMRSELERVKADNSRLASENARLQSEISGLKQQLQNTQVNVDHSSSGGFMSASEKYALENNKRRRLDGGSNDDDGFAPRPPARFVPPKKNTNTGGSNTNGNMPSFVKKGLDAQHGKDKEKPDNVAGIPLDAEGKLPGRLAACDSALVELIMHEMLDDKPGVTFNDIKGLDHAKKNVHEIVLWPIQRPDIFHGIRAAPKGMLLFGPPGTGKTMIGKAIATECDARFFSISASSLTSKWHGQGEKLVRTLFAVASYFEPSVIFLDEIDSLLSQRQDAEFEASRRIKTELLIQLDGASSDALTINHLGEMVNPRILLVGATNRPHEIDEAARRRLVKKLYVPLPNREARLHLLKHLLRQVSFNINCQEFEELVSDTKGYSGADLTALCTEAANEPIRDAIKNNASILSMDASAVRPVLLRDFKLAVNQVRSSVDAKDLVALEEWNQLYGSFPPEEDT